MAMGKEGLEVKWSKIKIWTLGNKAKRACKNSEEVKFRNSKEIQMQSLESQNQGVTNLPPLGKSRPQDSVAQETSKDMRISENLLFPRWLPPQCDDSIAPYKTLSLCCGWSSPSHPKF